MRYIFFFALIFHGNSYAQEPSIEWQRCYGGTGGDVAYDIKKTSDQGYILAAGTTSNNGDVTGNHGDSDYWIIKIDSLGNLQWQKCLGGSLLESATFIMQTSEGGYLVLGFTFSNDGDVIGNHGGEDIWVIKLDSLGNSLWKKCFGGSGYEEANSALETDDGNYLIAGYTESNDGDVSGNHDTINNRADAWVIKIDTAGNLLWQKCLGGSFDEKAYAVVCTNDHGYALSGIASSFDGDVSGVHGFGTYDYWLVKVDTSANIQWQKCYGGFMNNQFNYEMDKLTDGGFILGGYTLCDTTGDLTNFHGQPGSPSDMWVIRTDSFGNLLHQKCLGGFNSENAFALKQTSDGNFLVAGYTISIDGDVTGNHSQGYDGWVLKLDTSLNIMWQKCLGGSATDELKAIVQSNDGGLLVTGYATSTDGDVSGNHGGGDIWVVKLSPASAGIAIPANPITDFAVYLNPNCNILFLNFYANGKERTQIQLLDITGRLLLQRPLAVSIGFNKQEVNAGELNIGTYMVRLITEGGNVTKKLIKN
ncbi:lipoprotein [soil metagenome]